MNLTLGFQFKIFQEFHSINNEASFDDNVKKSFLYKFLENFNPNLLNRSNFKSISTKLHLCKLYPIE